VGNNNNRHPTISQLSQGVEESLGFAGSEHGSRLIENKDIYISVECFENLDALLFADTQFPDARPRINIKPVVVGE
jgi:hypothetical protein